MPIAPGLEDDDALREKYFDIMLDRFEAITGQSIRDSIVVKRSYALKDFKADYHSFKGNAYGLANTLAQTAFFKPSHAGKAYQKFIVYRPANRAGAGCAACFDIRADSGEGGDEVMKILGK
jgi:phytoene dehydrogenase-like protein